jgi:quercetin dioxygenase-like cupin family protein/predicted SnoaL-like aldol condensation-catalyzing enzyme
MRRPALPLLTCILAAVTTLALLGAAVSLREPRLAAPPDTASRDAVRRFYDAVNDVLRTGDPAFLDAVVAPDFVEHEPVPGTSPDRAGLGRYLTGLQAVFPRMALSVEALTAAGDLVMAHVAVLGAEHGAYLGMPLTGPVPTWGRLERFRVADGRIAERWADAGALGLLEPLQEVRVEVQPPHRQGVSVERVTLAPGRSLSWPDIFLGQRLLYVEAGSPTVLIDAASAAPALLTPAPTAGVASRRAPVGPGTERALSPGQLLVLPAGVTATTRADGQTPAALLHVTLAILDMVDPTDAQRQDAATPESAGQLLAGDLPTLLPDGAATVAIGRATLPPGAAIPAHQAAGVELITVEAGALALATTGETLWVRRGTTARPTTATAMTLTAADGALIAAGTGSTYRNAGTDPLVLLFVTITPVDQQGTA